MAKNKTKIGVMDTFAEFKEGAWFFTTGKHLWKWEEGVGINLFLRFEGVAKLWSPVIYARTLNDAILFANGFLMGVRCALDNK